MNLEESFLNLSGFQAKCCYLIFTSILPQNEGHNYEYFLLSTLFKNLQTTETFITVRA